MKKSITQSFNPYSPNLNLRSRKVIRKTNEALNNFTQDLTSTLNDVSTVHNVVTNNDEQPELYDLIENFDFEFFNENIEIISHQISKSMDEFEIVLHQVNLEVSKENSPWTWTLTRTQNGLGYKVFSCGYAYTIDKPTLDKVSTAKTIYWKCELHSKCSGRAISKGLEPPLNHKKKHTHNKDETRKDVLTCIEAAKQKAINTNDPPRTIMINILQSLSISVASSLSKPDAVRQMINRTRVKKFSFKKFTATSIAEIEIPKELRVTSRFEEFYWDDSGKDDINRVILFTTKENLSILNEHSDWYADGTFDISPTFFKQIYSIHVIKSGTLIPCLYAMLPNKKLVTYKKMFKMLKSFVNNCPKSINMDFEKAAMNAAQNVFNCKIHGCFFHLSQSLFRRVQRKGFIKNFALDEQFRYSFKLVQALAFVPVKDVIPAFKIIYDQCPESFEPIMDYFERVYIGKFKLNSKTQRVVPLFPVDMWNVFERVKLRLPRTNNNVENWHSRIQADVRKKLNVFMVVELLRQEQSKAENDYARLLNGEILKKKLTKKEAEKELNIERLVASYAGNVWEQLKGVANNFINFKKQ